MSQVGITVDRNTQSVSDSTVVPPKLTTLLYSDINSYTFKILGNYVYLLQDDNSFVRSRTH